MPQFDPSVNYNHTYWKIYLENELNLAMIREASERKQQLNELVTQIEVRWMRGRIYRTSTTGSTGSGTERRTEGWPHKSKKVISVPTTNATGSTARMSPSTST